MMLDRSAGLGPAEAELLAGDLARRHRGFTVVQWFDQRTLTALCHEATAAYDTADIQQTHVDDEADGRGGVPARSIWSAAGGPVQDAVYHDPELSRRLSALCEIRIVPSGGRGSYSYYLGGAFLALHRDIATCDLSMITVLSDTSMPSSNESTLVVYPDRNHEGLRAIRADLSTGAEPVRAGVGQTVLILGGIVAHQVLPTVAPSQRVVSVLCFEAVGH
ncbi:MAG: hypothetical protein WBM50_08575 [Acidimicrobiales bacterium]